MKEPCVLLSLLTFSPLLAHSTHSHTYEHTFLSLCLSLSLSSLLCVCVCLCVSLYIFPCLCLFDYLTRMHTHACTRTHSLLQDSKQGPPSITASSCADAIRRLWGKKEEVDG